MCIDSSRRRSALNCRSRVVRTLLVIGGALLMSLPSAAFAQGATACGPEVKEEVAKMLAEPGGRLRTSKKLATERAVYKQFQYCGDQDALLVPPSTFFAGRARMRRERVQPRQPLLRADALRRLRPAAPAVRGADHDQAAVRLRWRAAAGQPRARAPLRRRRERRAGTRRSRQRASGQRPRTSGRRGSSR